MKIYVYKQCDSCRKALQWLDSKCLEYESLPIREQTPSLDELRQMLAAYEGNLRKLFNVSGRDYREMGLKDRIADLSEEEALALLVENGNLIKRPFLLFGDSGLVGFKAEVWEAALEEMG